MPAPKSSFLDKVLGRIGRLDKEGLQTVVQRLARERVFLETLFNTIEDGVLVVDESGRVLYVNQAAARLLGLQTSALEGGIITDILPELEWKKILSHDKGGGTGVVTTRNHVRYVVTEYGVADLLGKSIRERVLAMIDIAHPEHREKLLATAKLRLNCLPPHVLA